MLRDTAEMLYPAVCETIAVLKLDPDGADAAAAKLAQQYARTIDDAPPGKEHYTRLRWLGPELQKILEALGATPAARAAIMRGAKTEQPQAPVSKLDRLREAHAKRA